jgi:hypothetical protein
MWVRRLIIEIFVTFIRPTTRAFDNKPKNFVVGILWYYVPVYSDMRSVEAGNEHEIHTFSNPPELFLYDNGQKENIEKRHLKR